VGVILILQNYKRLTKWQNFFKKIFQQIFVLENFLTCLILYIIDNKFII